MKALLIIDPQYDFVSPDGNLSIPRATEKLANLEKHILDKGKEYDKIYVTCDCHPKEHVSFIDNWEILDPSSVKDTMTLEDFLDGRVSYKHTKYKQLVAANLAKHNSTKERVLSMPNDVFMQELWLENLWTLIDEADAESKLSLWPVHCVKGTKGAEIMSTLMEAIKSTGVDYDIIEKGRLPCKEEFSAFSNWRELTLNGSKFFRCDSHNMMCMYDLLNNYAQIDICGFALDFCVADTFNDLAKATTATGSPVRYNVLAECSACIDPNNKKLKVYERNSEFLVK